MRIKMMQRDNSAFLADLKEWNLELSEEQLAQLEKYYEMLIEKNKVMNLTAKKGEKVDAPIIYESPVNIECKVKEIIPLGTHHMFLGEVVSVSVSDDYLDETGKFHFDKAKPICYSHGAYYGLGKKLGTFGYSVKKKEDTKPAKAAKKAAPKKKTTAKKAVPKKKTAKK